MARNGSDSAGGRLGFNRNGTREKGGGHRGLIIRVSWRGFIGSPDSLSSHRSQHGLSDTSAHTLVSSTRAEGPRFTDSHTQRVRRGLCTLLITDWVAFSDKHSGAAHTASVAAHTASVLMGLLRNHASSATHACCLGLIFSRRIIAQERGGHRGMT